MEMRQVDVAGLMNALHTSGEAKLSDYSSPVDYTQFQPVDNMDEVTHVFKKIFDGKKTYGTDTAKMGFFHEQVLAAKVDGNQITFALPFNGPIMLLKEILEKTHYNKTNSIMVTTSINDDNTELVATFYSKEYKLFMDY